MKKIFYSILLSIIYLISSKAQDHNLIGYWHNWQDANAPYIQLDLIDSRYDVVEVAFAVPSSPTDMTMLFTPEVVTQNDFISKIQTLQSQGKKVLISIGGATSNIDLTTTPNKTAFINSMISIINTYGFDGIDLDIENGNSIVITGGTIASPSNQAAINLISAVKQIMTNFRTSNNKKLMLTMASETAYVQGGQSAYGGIWGGYLPIIDALRDSLDILQVQLYNSGSMYGIDGGIYSQGTADFIVAMSEAVINGFSTAGGSFAGIPSNKVAVGLPACSSAAGGGYVAPATVNAAVKYLIGEGSQPGSYVLNNSAGYPVLRGMMTWSINWDAVSTCGNTYEYASNYQSIFGNTMPVETTDSVKITGGDLYITDISKGVIIKSPNGNCWRITIDNNGTVITTAVDCP
jgi:chitinase